MIVLKLILCFFEYAKTYLFKPLDIESYYWFKLNMGLVDGVGSLMITPEAMAKIGVTYLNNGIWNGNQIISEQWIGKSAASFLEIAG